MSTNRTILRSRAMLRTSNLSQSTGIPHLWCDLCFTVNEADQFVTVHDMLSYETSKFCNDTTGEIKLDESDLPF